MLSKILKNEVSDCPIPFALAKTNDFTLETAKVLKSNGKIYSYPSSLIPLFTNANLWKVEEETTRCCHLYSQHRSTSVINRAKGHILELYIYLLALESGILMNDMIGTEIDWKWGFPEG